MYYPEEQLLEHWVSSDRLTRYRDARESTTELYIWNASLSSAYFEISGHAEVLLRNVIHARLAPLSPGERWYKDERYPFTQQARRDIDTAIRRATKNGETPEKPGKVVAELSFGFWRFLLGAHYAATIWPKISPGFKGLPRHLRSRSDLEAAATRVNDLRNRVAHHEPVFHRFPEQYLADIYLIAKYVDDRSERMVRDLSRVPEVLSKRPPI